MRNDTIDVNSLVSFINDIKPYHSKLTEVTVEYQVNDNISIAISEKEAIDSQLSSVWEIQPMSDGVRTRYQIPAAVFPRHSSDIYQSSRIGVTDAIPGLPGAYDVPYNNAVDVTVNGVEQVVNVDYTIDSGLTTVQFIGSSIPVLGDAIILNWAVVDRIFIGIGTSQVVWQDYTIDYFGQNALLDGTGYDTDLFNDSTVGVFSSVAGQNETTVSPFGTVRIVFDANNQAYYVFDFFTAPPLNTNIWIRVEQRETYNGWTQTSITDASQVFDLFRFYDIANVNIIDPVSLLFSITANVYDSTTANFIDSSNQAVGISPVDTLYPSAVDANQNISISTSPPDQMILGIAENDVDFDHLLFDVGVYGSIPGVGDSYITIQDDADDGTTSSMLDQLTMVVTENGTPETPITTCDVDSNGMVYVSSAAYIDIVHGYGYNPIVTVYENGVMILPLSITYPSTGDVIVTFSTPMTVTIRLT